MSTSGLERRERHQASELSTAAPSGAYVCSSEEGAEAETRE